MRFVWLFLASLTALAACEPKATRVSKPMQRSATVQHRSVHAAKPLRGVLDDCGEILLDQSSKAGRFRVGICPAKAGGKAAAELRFVNQHATAAEIAIHPVGTLEAVVASEAKLWDGHLVSVDLAQERGGELVLGNWRQGAFVISHVPYATGDEEALGLTFRDAAFFISTESKGEQRLVEVESGEGAGAFQVEKASCRWEPATGLTQVMQLALNTQGRVNGLVYVGLTPQQNGTITSCSLVVDRDDGATRWTDDEEETLIDLEAEGPAGAVGRVRIRLDRGRYTVDFDLVPSRFCGQSSVHARSITLDPRTPDCELVMLAD